MKPFQGNPTFKVLALLALTLQVILPGSAPTGRSGEFDVGRFICAPSGQVSAEMRSAAERLAILLDEDAPEKMQSEGHCFLCNIVHTAPLPGPFLTGELARRAPDFNYAVYDPGFVRKAQGPPVGQRGPPTSR
jgi:hypothetical protein